jgi:hypothetical protein
LATCEAAVTVLLTGGLAERVLDTEPVGEGDADGVLAVLLLLAIAACLCLIIDSTGAAPAVVAVLAAVVVAVVAVAAGDFAAVGLLLLLPFSAKRI